MSEAETEQAQRLIRCSDACDSAGMLFKSCCLKLLECLVKKAMSSAENSSERMEVAMD